jgi:hypothetical protein
MVKKQTKQRVSSSKSSRLGEDFKTAALVVSVTINLAVFVGWLALKITTKYDAQVAGFLFDR